MSEIKLTFVGELNDFFPESDIGQPIPHYLIQPSSIKDVIEALGVPHPEVDIIIANDRSVDFSYQLRNGDECSIYPPGNLIMYSPIIHLTPPIKAVPSFVLDTHLGKLASYLRMLGIDTIYDNDSDDQRLAEISSLEDRTLLSRDIGLLKRKIVKRGYYIRSTIPRDQLVEVINRYQLVKKITPFRRCIHCNGILNPIHKSVVEVQLQENTRQYYDEFKTCEGCSKIYWKGSHYLHMQKFIGQIILQCNEKEN